MIDAIEPEAELFALAEQFDLAEKAHHDALAPTTRRRSHICPAKHQVPQRVRRGKNSRGTQWRQRNAGLRTNVLVAVGAAAFVTLGMRLNGQLGAVSCPVSGFLVRPSS
jgi:hypothetical protein